MMKYGQVLSGALLGIVLLAGFSFGQNSQQVCTTVIDCAQKAMEAAFQAKTAIRVAVPKGAVMAFNLSECPDGWEPLPSLAGRTIVGAGEGANLSARKLGEKGGEENHTLTVAEMPQHNHNNESFQYIFMMDGSWTIHDANGNAGEANLLQTRPLLPAGGNQPHNNMQPFYVLQYCQRT